VLAVLEAADAPWTVATGLALLAAASTALAAWLARVAGWRRAVVILVAGAALLELTAILGLAAGTPPVDDLAAATGPALALLTMAPVLALARSTLPAPGRAGWSAGAGHGLVAASAGAVLGAAGTLLAAAWTGWALAAPEAGCRPPWSSAPSPWSAWPPTPPCRSRPGCHDGPASVAPACCCCGSGRPPSAGWPGSATSAASSPGWNPAAAFPAPVESHPARRGSIGGAGVPSHRGGQ
jgi:hypothetical protein